VRSQMITEIPVEAGFAEVRVSGDRDDALDANCRVEPEGCAWLDSVSSIVDCSLALHLPM